MIHGEVMYFGFCQNVFAKSSQVVLTVTNTSIEVWFKMIISVFGMCALNVLVSVYHYREFKCHWELMLFSR
jgi:hypothetical protein